MFDWSGIDELGAAATADALARSRVRVLEAEAEQLRLAAHWADVNAPEFVEDCLAALPGAARAVDAGHDGCPQIDEFAGAELAALLGRTTQAGEQYIADAVNIRHRHPLLWSEIGDGTIPVWVATKVARKCARAGLTQEQAQWVDTHTTPYLATLPLSRFFALVDAKIIEADPAAAAARAEAEALRRFVSTGRTDEHGMKTLIARAHAGDVTYVVAVIDRIAASLGEQGDTDPVHGRRAKALRVLADPARALAMLTGATLDHADDGADPLPDGLGSVQEATGRWPAGLGLSSDGLVDQPLDEAVTGLDEGLGEQLRGLTDGPVIGDAASDTGAPGPLPVEDRQLLRSLLDALCSFDASRLDPVTTIHVHLSEAALHSASSTGWEGPRVARIEQVGPMLLEALRRWLGESTTPHRIELKPVLDYLTVVPVDRYEIPRPMRDLLEVREPFEVFPYGTTPSRSCDKDHRRAFVHGSEDDKPPEGQTSLDNLHPLGRKHHRLKTHGGWRVHHPEPVVAVPAWALVAGGRQGDARSRS